MRIRAALVTSAGAFLLACGGNGGTTAVDAGGTNVVGTVHGDPLSVVDSYATKGAAGGVTYLDVVLADFGNACATASAVRRNGSTLGLSFSNTLGSEPVTGTYDIGSNTGGTSLTAFFQKVDSQCNPIDRSLATSGSVQLSVSEKSVAGTVDLAFADGSLKGNFVTPICDVDAGPTPDGGQSTCQ